MAAVTNITHSKQSTMKVPTEWAEKYTDNDKAGVTRIVEWINAGQSHEPGVQNQRSASMLAKAISVSQATMSGVLLGTYVSPPGKHIKAILTFIDGYTNRNSLNGKRYVYTETSVSKTVLAACKRARTYQSFSVVAAQVGTGKTTALRHYTTEHANTYMVQGTPNMNAPVMLQNLVAATNATVWKHNKYYGTGTSSEKMDALVQKLTDTDSLLTLDEAEKVTMSTLEHLRRLSDLAEVGVVLSGNQRLYKMLRARDGKFGQISSRVGFWPPVIHAIKESDARALAIANLPEVDITDELHDAFWQCCEGSARVLVKQLIPGLRDFFLKKGKELSTDAVFATHSELLGYNS